ncbi:YopX family protein [Bacillus cereus]
MNREIKYRAYVRELNLVLPVLSISFDFKRVEVPTVNSKVAHTELFHLEQVDLLQYTGLKDSKGNEIYEGDILKREFEVGHEIIDPDSLGVVDYEVKDSGCFIGVVCYRPSEGYVLNSCKKFNDEGELQNKRSGVKIYARYAEVIGNIFENSDLLKGDEE